jgi:hypothetical protein
MTVQRGKKLHHQVGESLAKVQKSKKKQEKARKSKKKQEKARKKANEMARTSTGF